MEFQTQYWHIIVHQYANCAERIDLGYLSVSVFQQIQLHHLENMQNNRHHNFTSPLACIALNLLIIDVLVLFEYQASKHQMKPPCHISLL